MERQLQPSETSTGDEPTHGVVSSSPELVTCGVAELASKDLRLEADAPNVSAVSAAPQLLRPPEPEPRQPTPAPPPAVSLGASGGRLRLRVVRASRGSPGIAPAGVRAPLPAPLNGSQRPTGSPPIAPPARAQLDGSVGSSALEARFTAAAAGGVATSLPHGATAASPAEARAAAAEAAAAADRAALAAARADIDRLQSALQAAEGAVASLQRAASQAQDAQEDALLEAHRERARADGAVREAARAAQEAQLLLRMRQGAAQAASTATAAAAGAVGHAERSSATAAAAERCSDAAAQQATAAALLAAASRRGQPISWDVAMPRVIALSDTRAPQRAGCGCGIGRCSRALTRLILRLLVLALLLGAAGLLALQWDAGKLTPRHVATSLLQAQGRHPQLQRWIRLEAADGCLYAAQQQRLPLCLSEADRAWAVAGGGRSALAPAEALAATTHAQQHASDSASSRLAQPFQAPETSGDRTQPGAQPTTLPPPAADPGSGDNQSALAWASLDAAGGWSAGGRTPGVSVRHAWTHPFEPMPLQSA